MASISVYCDVIGNRLVKGLNNSDAFVFPKLFQASAYPIVFYPVEPTNSRTPPLYSKQAADAMTLEVAVGPSAGSESLLAYQGTFVVDGDAESLTGTLDLNTGAMNTAIGNNASIESVMQFILSDAGVKRVVYQESVRIFAGVLAPTGAATLPTTSDQYYTKAAIDAICVKWVNSAIDSRGKTISLYSPDGARVRSLGVDNTGNPVDYII